MAPHGNDMAASGGLRFAGWSGTEHHQSVYPVPILSWWMLFLFGCVFAALG